MQDMQTPLLSLPLTKCNSTIINWDFFLILLINFMVTEYIQAQTGDGGSIRTFNHRLGWTVTVLEWFFEGHFTAVLSIHQC